MKRLSELLAALLLWALLPAGLAHAYACPTRPPPAPTEDYQGFLGRVFELDGVTMPYRLFVPDGYDGTQRYPLVLYLHHAGLAGDSGDNETGLDNCVQLTSEIGSGGYGGVFVHSATAADNSKFVTQDKYPHFLLAPHAASPAYGFGGGVEGSASGPEHRTRAALYGILDEVQSEFNIDSRRIYVTGISMGCYGTWDIIMRNPGYFAAASPQSCRGDPDTQLLSQLVDAPIWSMCGTNDSYFGGAQAMADAMQEVGANAFIFTPFEGVGHSIHDLGYDYPGFIDWMFEQSLPAPPDAGVGNSAGDSGIDVTSPTAGAAGAVASAGAPAVVATAGGGASMTAGAAGSVATPIGVSDTGCACSLGAPSRSRVAQLVGLILVVFLYRRSRSRSTS